MEPQALVLQLVSAVREFIAPSYRPEFHYMRGPGPACARRAGMVEARRALPAQRDERNRVSKSRSFASTPEQIGILEGL
jgi:hypothetical protein